MNQSVANCCGFTSIPKCIIRIEIFWLFIFVVIWVWLLSQSWLHPIGVMFSPGPVELFVDACIYSGFFASLAINGFLQPLLLALSVLSLIPKTRNLQSSLLAVLVSSVMCFCVLIPFKMGDKIARYVVTAIYGTPHSHAAALGYCCDPAKSKIFLNGVEARLYWVPPKGHEGDTVTVTFKVGKDGNVSGLRLLRSSGCFATDQFALKTVKNACLYKWPPTGLNEDIEIGVTFSRP